MRAAKYSELTLAEEGLPRRVWRGDVLLLDVHVIISHRRKPLVVSSGGGGGVWGETLVCYPSDWSCPIV